MQLCACKGAVVSQRGVIVKVIQPWWRNDQSDRASGDARALT